MDFDTGIITNKTKNQTYQAQPFPDFGVCGVKVSCGNNNVRVNVIAVFMYFTELRILLREKEYARACAAL